MSPETSLFADRERLARTPAHAVALDCLAAGIEAADPARLTRETVSLSGSTLTVGEATYDLASYEEVVVLGGGNAAGVVAAELEALVGDRLSGGVVVTDSPVATDRIDVRRGDHPLPSERGVAATRDVLAAARAADDRTLVLAVVTGGGSALMTAPAAGLSLSALRSTIDALLASGATIAEINAVRKHCSAVKGGRLAAALAPADVCGLLLSDVVGNDPSTIASGPFVPDETTYETALAVLERYDLTVPSAVRTHLRRGAAGEIDETPIAGAPVFDRVRLVLLGDNLTALRAAADRAAASAGFEPLVLSSRIRGEAREAAKTQVAIAEESRATGEPIEPPAVVVSGGETTVTVRGDGVGGPNQEFALSAALELASAHGSTDDEATDGPIDGPTDDEATDGPIDGSTDDEATDGPTDETIKGLTVSASAAGIVVAAVDTDGIDGPTDAAGGLVDADTVGRATGTADHADALAAAHRALADNDAQDFLERAGALLTTGPTGTNVNDLRVLVVPADGS